MLSLKKQKPKTRPKKKRWGEEADYQNSAQWGNRNAWMQSCRTDQNQREEGVICWQKSRTRWHGSQDPSLGRLTTSSSWWAQIPWGPFLIALQGPSCSCFSAVTCDPKASEMTNEGEVQKVLSLQPAEGEGNCDLNSQLPQCIFVFWSAGEKNLPFSQPPIFILIFTFIQMGLLCFLQTRRETKNKGDLSYWEEWGSLHGEQRKTEYAKGRLGPLPGQFY